MGGRVGVGGRGGAQPAGSTFNHTRRRDYPRRLRRVVARVEVDGREREMVFLTHNPAWAAGSVAELYRCRWPIECFFKQIKQTLQLADFLGNSANAVRWQLWSALRCSVLPFGRLRALSPSAMSSGPNGLSKRLRCLALMSRWAGSFTRLWAVGRSALWRRLDLRALLESYGTAGGSFRCLAQPEALWLPGLRPRPVG